MAKVPASLQYILNPCESLTKISFEDEQDVESLCGDDVFVDSNGDTISSNASAFTQVMLEEKKRVPETFEPINCDVCINQADNYFIDTGLESNMGVIIGDDIRAIDRKRKRGVILNNDTNPTQGLVKRRSKVRDEQIDAQEGESTREEYNDTPRYKSRIRLSLDQRRKIEDLARQGNTISDIVDLLVQHQHDGSWGRSVSRSTINRIYNEVRKDFSSESVGEEVDELDADVGNDETAESIPPLPAVNAEDDTNGFKDTENKPGLSTEHKGNLVTSFRLSKDERHKIEDMVREGKTVRDIVDLLREEYRKGTWTRRVSESTIFRIHRKVKSQGN
ncbi:hypothetical protein O9G_000669 [Rozella allomycis CSF55]|uniref:Uncharacterized protein n=1 Tax=Rozella allomycis (strain CSF55) TaxID=988480 RepID=A0A075B392_ROZAC|nr:hypothetical protein O9G_000669 [Rozella allomycis CSF55]|eukprot:EPZ35273.1 hypothetical protein O9G_000669 [Rozella allomycis CSF55]